MADIDLEEVRAAIAESNFLKKGSTTEARQAANAERVRLYRQLDKCRHKLEKLKETEANQGQRINEIEVLRREVEALSATLTLQSVQRKPWALIKGVDLMLRVPAVFFFVLFMAFILSIPLIVITMIEQQLYLITRRRRARNGHAQRGSNIGDEATPIPSPTNSDDAKLGQEVTAGRAATTFPRDSCRTNAGVDEYGNVCGYGGVSSLIKRLDARFLLLLMGVSVRAEGLKQCRLSRPALLLFTHVSTLDAMIILGSFPRAMCAIVKEELFAVPIVGWVMASHGGMPINRRHRASAVQALANAGTRARELELFIAMSPEGTRSKTGQLGSFKKGAFHVQEQLRWPVIPVTIRGAYELYPLRAYFNDCGRVVVRFHRPIEAADIKSRDSLSDRLREELLDAAEIQTPEAGRALSPAWRAASFAAVLLTDVAAAWAVRSIVSLSRREGVGVWTLILGAVTYTAASSVFVYFVYARKCLGTHKTAFAMPRAGKEPRVNDGVADADGPLAPLIGSAASTAEATGRKHVD